MQLPGRLRHTTLGDLLGTLHRAKATGALELVEDRGRLHRIHVYEGLVAGVDLDGAAPSIAEVLRRERLATNGVATNGVATNGVATNGVATNGVGACESALDQALRRKLQLRIQLLEKLPDAQIHFRVAVRPPRVLLREHPLGPTEFLTGRRRARDATASAPPVAPRPPKEYASEASRGRPSESAAPWSVLGVEKGASFQEIRRAYRALARSLHPDLHPHASEGERRRMTVLFTEVTAAYRALVA